ncbi:MAG: DNA primase [Firmicutes bacterium]|nr:DNA primase [Bacillota bacterium]
MIWDRGYDLSDSRVVVLANPIPENMVEQIRNQFDLVEVVSRYTALKEKGNRFWGLCPFHNEKTPSFTVSPDKQLYHCFGCGAGGDIFQFVMDIENVDFPEAVRLLAAQAGIRIPEGGVADSSDFKLKTMLFDVHKLAARFYHYILYKTTAGKEALTYLKKRGLSDRIIHRFGLGFAPDRWDSLLRFAQRKGIGPNILLKAGLVTHRQDDNGYYDRFRGRIIFPIFDLTGRVIGFGGRTLKGLGPKYLNSPETPLFNKSSTLYGFNFARGTIRKKQQAIIVEGYMDVITAHQFGLEQTVACLGTALTERQAYLLRQQAEEVFIAFDADVAGENATWRGLDVLRSAGCQVRVAPLPEGDDPDLFLRSKGAAAFQNEILQKAVPVSEYRLKQILSRYNLQDRQEMLQCLHQSLLVLAEISDNLERDEYIRLLAGKFSVSEEALRLELKKLRQKYYRSTDSINIKAKRGQNNSIIQVLDEGHDSVVKAAERQLVAIMVRDMGKIDVIKQHLQPEDFNCELYRGIVQQLFELTEQEKERRTNSSWLLSVVSGREEHRLISEIFLEEPVEEEQATKIIADCIKTIKIKQLQRQKDVLEKAMKSLGNNKSGSMENLLKQWWEIRKREQELYRSGEGED